MLESASKPIILINWQSLFNDIMTLPANLFINIHGYFAVFIFLFERCLGTTPRNHGPGSSKAASH